MANTKNDVYLRPSEIRYSQFSILNTFQDGGKLGELLDDLCYGRCFISAIKPIEVAVKNGQWYSADNRRLWVLKKCELLGMVEIILVKVRKRIFHGKMTTKDNGKSVIIRGGPPGGKIYDAFQLALVEKENTPKKRKRRRNRGKKKKKNNVGGDKVTKEDDDVGQHRQTSVIASKKLYSCETKATAKEAPVIEEHAPITYAFQSKKSNQYVDVQQSIAQEISDGSSDESEHPNASSNYNDVGNMTEIPDYDDGDFSYESMYESSEDEDLTECNYLPSQNAATTVPYQNFQTKNPFLNGNATTGQEREINERSQKSKTGIEINENMHYNAQAAKKDLVSSLLQLQNEMDESRAARSCKIDGDFQMDSGACSSRNYRQLRNERKYSPLQESSKETLFRIPSKMEQKHSLSKQTGINRSSGNIDRSQSTLGQYPVRKQQNKVSMDVTHRYANAGRASFGASGIFKEPWDNPWHDYDTFHKPLTRENEPFYDGQLYAPWKQRINVAADRDSEFHGTLRRPLTDFARTSRNQEKAGHRRIEERSRHNGYHSDSFDSNSPDSNVSTPSHTFYSSSHAVSGSRHEEASAVEDDTTASLKTKSSKEDSFLGKLFGKVMGMFASVFD